MAEPHATAEDNVEPAFHCISCPRSFQLGRDEDNLPKVLPCGHILCHGCVSTLIWDAVGADDPQCPVDRTPLRGYRSPDDLPTALSVLNAVAGLRLGPEDHLPCAFHGGSLIHGANFVALGSGQALCDTCVTSKPTTGPIHRIADAMDEVVGELPSLLAHSQALESTLQRHLLEASSALERQRADRVALETEIDDFFDRLISALNSKRIMLQEKLRAENNARQKELANKTKWLAQSASQLSETNAFGSAILACEVPPEEEALRAWIDLKQLLKLPQHLGDPRATGALTFRTMSNMTPEELADKSATVLLSRACATNCFVDAKAIISHGVVVGEEFEFDVHVRDAEGEPSPVDISSQLVIQVEVNPDPLVSNSGTIKSMPYTVREDTSTPGRYIVRSICQPGPSASRSQEVIPLMIHVRVCDAVIRGSPARVSACTLSGGDAVLCFGERGKVAGELESPREVAVDAAGNVVVADKGNHRVQVFSPHGAILANLGSGRGAAPEEFNRPWGVAAGCNRIFVADRLNNAVKVYSDDGTFQHMIGSGHGVHEGCLSYPSGVAVHAPSETVFVADTRNNRVQAFAVDGTLLRVYGANGDDDSKLSSPLGVAPSPDGTLLYVADTGSNSVKVYLTSDASLVRSIGNGKGAGPGYFNQPSGVVASPNGLLYVSDTLNHRIQVFNDSGHYLASLGKGRGSLTGQFEGASGLAVSNDGKTLYVSDWRNHRVQGFRTVRLPSSFVRVRTVTPGPTPAAITPFPVESPTKFGGDSQPSLLGGSPKKPSESLLAVNPIPKLPSARAGAGNGLAEADLGNVYPDLVEGKSGALESSDHNPSPKQPKLQSPLRDSHPLVLHSLALPALDHLTSPSKTEHCSGSTRLDPLDAASTPQSARSANSSASSCDPIIEKLAVHESTCPASAKESPATSKVPDQTDDLLRSPLLPSAGGGDASPGKAQPSQPMAESKEQEAPLPTVAAQDEPKSAANVSPAHGSSSSPKAGGESNTSNNEETKDDDILGRVSELSLYADTASSEPKWKVLDLERTLERLTTRIQEAYEADQTDEPEAATIIEDVVDGLAHANQLIDLKRDLWQGSTMKEACQKSTDIIKAKLFLEKRYQESLVSGYVDYLLKLARAASNRSVIIREGGLKTLITIMDASPSLAIQRLGCGAIRNLSVNSNNAAIVEAGGVRVIIRAMNDHIADSRLQRRAMGALKNLAQSSDAGKTAIPEAGGLDVIVSVLRAHVAHLPIQQAGCGALRELSQGSTNAGEIATVGGIDAVIAALWTHPKDVELVESCLICLRNLSRESPANRHTVSTVGGDSAVIFSMREHPNSCKIQAAACGAIRFLAVDEDIESALGEAGAIELVCAAVSKFFEDETLFESGCAALRNLSFRNVSARRRIADTRVIPRLFEGMNAHQKASALQESACGCLRNLALDGLNEVTITQAGGIDVLVKAMVSAPSHAGVQEAAAGAIRNLSYRQDASRTAIARAGGIGSLILALKTFRRHPGVLEACAGALRNLAVDEANETEIVAQGAIQPLVDGLNTHIARPGALEAIAGAIRNLTFRSDEARVTVAKIGGVAALGNALAAFKEDKGVQLAGFGALRNLALSDETKNVIPLSVIVSVVEGMRAHEKCAAVQGAGGWALRNLAVKPEIRAQISECGGLPVLVQGLKEHLRDVGVQQAIIGALRNMSCNAENKTAIVQEGAVEVLVQSMKMHKENDAVQEAAAGAIRNFAFGNSENKERIPQAGGIAVLLHAMEQHESVAGVQEAVAGALRNLASNNAANKTAIGEMGGVELLLRAVQNHMTLQSVQDAVCGALRNLVNRNEANEQRMMDAKGPTILQEVMAANESSASLQEAAAGVLRSLAFRGYHGKPEEANAMRRIIPQLLRACHVHVDNATLQETVVGALRNLSAEPSNEAAIISSGGIESLLVALKRHPDNLGLYKVAIATLRNLVCNPEAGPAIASAAKAVLEGMRKYRDCVSLQESSCGTLSNIAAREDYKETSVVAQSSIPEIVITMTTHESKAAVQITACTAFHNMTTTFDSVRKSIVSEGGADAILRGMVAHKDDEKVQEAACAAVRNLACYPPNRLILSRKGLLQQVMDTFQKHFGNEGVMEAACWAMKNIATETAEVLPVFEKTGTIETLVKLIRSAPENESLATAAVEAVKAGSDGFVIDVLRDAGYIPKD